MFKSLGCKRRYLSINRLKVRQDLFQLPLGHLKQNLLLLLVVFCRFVFFEVHLDVQDWLLDSVLVLARNLDIKAPVKVTHLWQAAELVLIINLSLLGYFAHHFEQEHFNLLGETLWKPGGKRPFIVDA